MVGHQVITPPWKLGIFEPVSLPIPTYRLRRNYTTRQLLSTPLQILQILTHLSWNFSTDCVVLFCIGLCDYFCIFPRHEKTKTTNSKKTWNQTVISNGTPFSNAFQHKTLKLSTFFYLPQLKVSVKYICQGKFCSLQMQFCFELLFHVINDYKVS